MIEISLDTMAVDADAPDEEAISQGAHPHVVAQIVGGSALPLADPRTNRPMRFPSMAVNFALSKESALQLSDLLREKAESLPSSPSGKIVTAQSLDGIEKVANLQDHLKKP